MKDVFPDSKLIFVSAKKAIVITPLPKRNMMDLPKSMSGDLLETLNESPDVGSPSGEDEEVKVVGHEAIHQQVKLRAGRFHSDNLLDGTDVGS